MDSASALIYSCLNGLGPRIEAGEIGEQRGVNIDDSLRKSVEKGGAEESHEPREAN